MTQLRGGQTVLPGKSLLITVLGSLDWVSIQARLFIDRESIAGEAPEGESLKLRIRLQYLPGGVAIGLDPLPNLSGTRGSKLTLFVNAGPDQATVPVLISLS